MLFDRVLICMYTKYLITVIKQHDKCVYYSICIRTFVFQVNQIQHVKNIQLEIKSTVKMLVNNDTNILRGIKLLDQNIAKPMVL